MPRNPVAAKVIWADDPERVRRRRTRWELREARILAQIIRVEIALAVRDGIVSTPGERRQRQRAYEAVGPKPWEGPQ